MMRDISRVRDRGHSRYVRSHSPKNMPRAACKHSLVFSRLSAHSEPSTPTLAPTLTPPPLHTPSLSSGTTLWDHSTVQFTALDPAYGH